MLIIFKWFQGKEKPERSPQLDVSLVDIQCSIVEFWFVF